MANDSDKKFIDVDEILNDLSKSDPFAQDVGKRATQVAKQLGLSAKVAGEYGGMTAVVVQAALAIFSLLISLLVKLAAPLLTFFLKLLGKFRTETIPEQIEISTAVLSEFLATEIDPAHLKPGKTGDQTIDAATAIGGALIDRLTKEFAPSGQVTAESGEKAAKTFAGYAVNFGVQNALIGTAADAISFHFLEHFRDLGVEVAQNLGLGRLVRQALLPLVRNTIAEPYDQLLKKRYRPDLLSEQHTVDAFQGGMLSYEETQDVLARKGYSDKYIGIVTDMLRKHLTADELEVLQRAGDLGEEFPIASLKQQGYDDVIAKQKLRVQRLQRTDSLIGIYKNLISKQRSEGLLDEDAYNKLLDRLPITEEEKQLERNYVGQVLELPRSFLPWTEVKKAFELGAVDLDYVDRWLQREGFSDEDQLIRELLLFDELGKKLDKAQAAADKASRKVGQKPQ